MAEDLSFVGSCRNITCDKKGAMKRCAACKHAFYCSKTCQKQDWKKHKPNCIDARSSLHNLFEACGEDEWPALPAMVDYGFLNMQKYYGNEPLGQSNLTPDQLLLGLFHMITRDIKLLDYGETQYTLSSIDLSKKMLLAAYEGNNLDAFIHRYISNVLESEGKDRKNYWEYGHDWLENKLIIGPTRPLTSLTGVLTEEEVLRMRSEIYRKYYED